MENENRNPNLSTRFATGSASDTIDSDDWDQVEDLPKPKVQHAMLTPILSKIVVITKNLTHMLADTAALFSDQVNAKLR